MAKKRNGATPEIPDGLSKQDRIAAVAGVLIQLQRQELELTLQQDANGDADEALVPGLPPEGNDGTPTTYANRRKTFVDGQQRIVTKHRDLMGPVRAYIAGLHASQP